MARMDITMNPSLGEVNTSVGLAGKVFYPFRLSGVTDRPVRLYFINDANIIHVFSRCKFFANFLVAL